MSRIIGAQLSTTDLVVDSSTASVDTTSGALQVAGGVGIAGAVNIGGNLAVTGTASAAAPTLDTHLATKLYVDTATVGGGDVVGPTGATDNAIARFDTATGKLIKNSSATINNSGDLIIAGYSIQGTNVGGIQIAGLSVELLPDLVNSGFADGGASFVRGGTAGSSSTGNGGPVVIDGGVCSNAAGVGGNVTITGGQNTGGGTAGNVILVGGDGAVDGYVRVSTITDATSSSSGAFVCSGGVGIAKKLYVGTDVSVGGNLAVTGTASAATPTLDTHLATKLYVDTATSDKVVGPASATANAICRFSGTTGKVIQNSTVGVVDNFGNVIMRSTIQSLGVTPYTTSGNITHNHLSGSYSRCRSSGVNITLTLPTAANLDTVYPGATYTTSGNAIFFYISNEDATATVTLAGNTGVSLQGTRFTVASNTIAIFHAVKINIGFGTPFNWIVTRIDST